MIKQEAVEILIKRCRSEIGYKEQGVNLNKYAENLDKYDTFYIPINGYAWCAVFVIDMFVETFGYEVAQKLINFDNHSCSCSWWSSRMLEVDFSEAEPGDIWMNNKKSHTGIVETTVEAKDHAWIISGNNDNSVGVHQVTGGHIYRPMWGEIEQIKLEADCAIDWAIAKEIFLGDGNGNYRWKDSITREEVAIVLKRLTNLIEDML